MGFGVLFVGLSFMSDSINPLQGRADFCHDLPGCWVSNPLLGILAGVIVTGIIQSSSASVGILQTLAMNGVVDVEFGDLHHSGTEYRYLRDCPDLQHWGHRRRLSGRQ